MLTIVLVCVGYYFQCCVFFFKQKTAYEMRISDWSSDVCSSDLVDLAPNAAALDALAHELFVDLAVADVAAILDLAAGLATRTSGAAELVDREADRKSVV